MIKDIFKYFISFALVIMAANVAFAAADKPDFKYGKPSKEELAMTQLDKNPAATAAVLFKTCNVSYDFNINDGLNVVYEYQTRLKIFKPEGVKYGTVAIEYHDNGDGLMVVNDQVLGLEAITFNSEGGKEKKSKMKDSAIKKTSLGNNLVKLEFTAPDLKEGSVVDFKYRIKSARLTELRTWQQQEEIPVNYSRLELGMIEFFPFAVTQNGSNSVLTGSKPNSITYVVKEQYESKSISVKVMDLTYTTAYLPALSSADKNAYNAEVFTLSKSFLPWVIKREADSGRTQNWNDRSGGYYSRQFTDDVDKKLEALAAEKLK